MTGKSAVRFLAALAVAAVLTGCGPVSASNPAPGGGNADGAAPAARPSATAAPYDISGLLHPSSGKYLGVEANGAPDSLNAVRAFAASLGKKPDLIGQYVAWGSPFDASAAIRAWSYGAIDYLSWEPYSTSVAAIASGHSNAYITRFATAVRALNLPVAISFGHEMNGNWYPWGVTGATPAQFVAAWRLIHALFTGVGASNVIWVWNPNDIFPMPQIQLRPYWPGDSYVDWVGITGYFATVGPQTFATLYQPTIEEIRQFTGKPVLIAETSVETGPDEVACVDNLVNAITRHPDVLGFIWFDYDKAGVDWRVESRPVLSRALSTDLAGLQVVDAKQ